MKLIRDDQNSVRTFGYLLDEEEHLCETLELPWVGNQRNISCIPEGTYPCELLYSWAHKRFLYWLQNVPGRGAIEIHVGNFVKDTQGCILLGEGRGPDVLRRSKMAFDKFMERMGGQDFMLTIEKEVKV